jgi:hypothetical protein
MTETLNLICFNCKHWKKYDRGCTAFPDGIPDEVLIENEHDKPLPNQENEIVFELIDKSNYE